MNGRKISGIRVSTEIMRDYLVLEFFVAEAATMAAFVGSRILSSRFCLAGVVIAIATIAGLQVVGVIVGSSSPISVSAVLVLTAAKDLAGGGSASGDVVTGAKTVVATAKQIADNRDDQGMII